MFVVLGMGDANYVCVDMQITVIKTRSGEFMPFCQSLACFLCGTCWFVYGLISRDIFLYVSVSNRLDSKRFILIGLILVEFILI